MRQKKSQAAYFMKVLISILFTIYINNSFSQELKPISKFYYFETEIMRLKSNETLNKGVLAFIPTLEKIVLLVDSINYEEEELNKLNLQLNSPPITSSFEKNKKLLEKSLEIISNPEGFELEALDSIYIKFYEIRKRMLKSIRSQIVLSKEIIEAKTSKKNNSDRIEIIKK
jgi:hypothetical protein